MAPLPGCRRWGNVFLSPLTFNYRRDTLPSGVYRPRPLMPELVQVKTSSSVGEVPTTPTGSNKG